MLKATLLQALDDARAARAELVTSQSGAGMGTWEEWSAKDHIAHQAGWQQTFLEQLAAWQRGAPITASEEFQARNEEIFSATHEQSLETVQAEAERCHEAMRGAVEGFSEEQLADAGPDGQPLWRSVIGNGYMHPLLHFIDFYLKQGDIAQAGALHEAMAARLPALDPSEGWQGTLRYNFACYYALAGQPDRALPLLSEALALAPNLRDWSREDSDLVALHGLAEYEALYTETETA